MAAWHLLGQGLGAELAALVLARVADGQALHWTQTPSTSAAGDAARVLALSPHSVQCLAGWGVRLEGLEPIRAMHIASRPDFADGLHLAAPTNPPEPSAPIAYTLPLEGLRRAIAAALRPHKKRWRMQAPAAFPQLVFLASRAAWRQCGLAPPRRRDFRQHALGARLAHTRPHENVARQVFLRRGPLALLPLAGRMSALIWTLPSARARALAQSDAALFAALVQEQSGGVLGRMRLDGARTLSELTHYQTSPQLSLPHLPFGAAAQLVHPLAGLGFNLTVRDIAGLEVSLGRARTLGLPADSPSLWHPWWRARRADAALVGGLTGGLNRMFAARVFLRPLAACGLNALGAAENLPRASLWQNALVTLANRGLA